MRVSVGHLHASLPPRGYPIRASPDRYLTQPSAWACGPRRRWVAGYPRLAAEWHVLNRVPKRQRLAVAGARSVPAGGSRSPTAWGPPFPTSRPSGTPTRTCAPRGQPCRPAPRARACPRLRRVPRTLVAHDGEFARASDGGPCGGRPRRRPDVERCSPPSSMLAPRDRPRSDLATQRSRANSNRSHRKRVARCDFCCGFCWRKEEALQVAPVGKKGPTGVGNACDLANARPNMRISLPSRSCSMFCAHHSPRMPTGIDSR